MPMTPQKESVGRALATNTAVQAVGKVVSVVIGVVIVGLMTRLLGQEGFGKYSTANAFLQVFAILMDLGLNVMLVQMLGERKGDEKAERNIVSALFTLRLVMAFVVISIAPIIGWFIPSYDHELKLALFAIWGSFFFTLLNQVVVGVQQRHLKMHAVAISEVAGRVTLLVGVLIAIAHGWGLVEVVWIVSLGGFVNFLINFLVASRYADFRWNVDVAFWVHALKRSWPIGVSVAFSLIYFKADVLILGWVRPQSDVGVYSAAYRVLEILVAFPFMYAGVLLPIIAHAWKTGAKDAFHRLVQRSVDAMALVTFPMIFGTLAVATPVMTLVASDEFTMSGDVLRILILATGAIFMATVFSHAVVALDAQKAMLPWYIGTAIFAVIGYAYFIPLYGLWAAAWLTVATEVAVLVGNIVVTIQKGKRSFEWSTTFKAFVASVATYAVAWALLPLSLALAVLGGVAVYIILVFAMKAVTPEILKELFQRPKGVASGEGSI